MARAPARSGGGYSQGDPFGLKPSTGVITLIVIYLLSWMLLRFGGDAAAGFIGHYLLLTPREAIGVMPWQLVTNGFVIDGLRNVIYVAVTLIFFGNAIERTLGAGKLWQIFVAGIVGGSLLWAVPGRFLAPDMTVQMATAADTAILVAYAIQLDRTQVSAFGMVNMRAGSMAWIWVGIEVVGALADVVDRHYFNALVSMVGIVGGGIAGWLMVRRGGIHVGSAGEAFDKVRLWRLRRRYKVLQGGRPRDDKRYLN